MPAATLNFSAARCDAAPIPAELRPAVERGGILFSEEADLAWRAAVEASPGTSYAYLLDDDDTPLPDPRSCWQPDGVHRPSRVYDENGNEMTLERRRQQKRGGR